MATRFAGFPAEMPKFFKGLERNNNREWFQKQKSVYEEKVKAPMVELVECLNQELAKFAPDLPSDHLLVMNLCGRGDKDVFTVAEALGVAL